MPEPKLIDPKDIPALVSARIHELYPKTQSVEKTIQEVLKDFDAFSGYNLPVVKLTPSLSLMLEGESNICHLIKSDRKSVREVAKFRCFKEQNLEM